MESNAKGDALIEMKIYIRGEYHREEEKAKQDRQYLKHLFAALHGDGMETVYLSDWKEYRATLSLDTDDYEIEKK